MLSGSPPFEATPDDPLALIHKHIAVQPIPLEELNELQAHASLVILLFLLINTPYYRLYQHCQM